MGVYRRVRNVVASAGADVSAFFTGGRLNDDAQQLAVKPGGITGTTSAARFVGFSGSQAPTTGTFQVGDFTVGDNGMIYVCSIAGTPGSWTRPGWQAGGTVAPIGTASASGTASGWSRGDHVHAQQANLQPGAPLSPLPAGMDPARWVGYCNNVAPTTGTYAKGDWVMDLGSAVFRVCTVAGTPGTWSPVPKVGNTVASPLGAVAAAGFSSGWAAREDHVHPYDPLWYHGGHAVDVGEEVVSRVGLQGLQMSSGRCHFAFFTARKTETITQVMIGQQANAATATTLARIGIYSTDSNGNPDQLLASTANDTTLFASAFNTYTRTLTTPFSKVKGTRYAFAVMWIGTGSPQLSCQRSVSNFASPVPRVIGQADGWSDLPNTKPTVAVSSDIIPAGLLLP